MKNLVFVVLLLSLCWLVFPVLSAEAVGCTGQSCDGLNPDTMGCGADAIQSGRDYRVPDGVVQTKRSAACDAKWSRAINKSGGNRYGITSINFGGVNYNSNYVTTSGGLIGHDAVIYSPMRGLIPTPVRACANFSLSSPVTIPFPLSWDYCMSQS